MPKATAAPEISANQRAQKARYEATQALVEMHKDDFVKLHQEAKDKYGIRDAATRSQESKRKKLEALAAELGVKLPA